MGGNVCTRLCHSEQRPWALSSAEREMGSVERQKRLSSSSISFRDTPELNSTPPHGSTSQFALAARNVPTPPGILSSPTSSPVRGGTISRMRAMARTESEETGGGGRSQSTLDLVNNMKKLRCVPRLALLCRALSRAVPRSAPRARARGVTGAACVGVLAGRSSSRHPPQLPCRRALHVALVSLHRRLATTRPCSSSHARTCSTRPRSARPAARSARRQMQRQCRVPPPARTPRTRRRPRVTSTA